MEQNKELKTYGYYITTAEGKILEWVADAYTAAKHANAKADTFYKTYYVYNCKTKTSKAYHGFHTTNTRLSRFNYYCYVMKQFNNK